MVKLRNKLLLVAALGATLVGCGTTPTNPHVLHESPVDLIGNNTGVRLSKGQIGAGTEVKYSNVFAQFGVNPDGNYCLRFATAVQGEIETISYTRKGIEGINNGLDETYEVTTVYKAVVANGAETYFDGTAPSTTAGAGDYYWACYTICYESEAAKSYYGTDIEISISINGETVGNKVSSLNDVINSKNEAKSYFFEAESANLTSGSFNFRTDEVIVNRNILGNVNGNVGAVISFDVEADNPADAMLYVSSCERAKVINVDEALKIEVNGKQVTSGEIIKPLNEGYEYWFTYSEKKLADINLVKGINNITITIVGADTFSIDYFKVITKAKITNGQEIACKQLCNNCGKCVDLECGYHEDKCVHNGENTYRFEARDAILAGGNKVEVGSFVGNNGSGKSITFKFNADKAGVASLSGAISTNGIAKKDVLFSNFFTVIANGKDLDLTGIKAHRLEVGSWFDFIEIGLGCIELVEGENIVVFNGVSGASFSYAMINTDSVINDGVSTHHHLCPTCNKSIDSNCRATECAEKCDATGTKYEFAPTEATFDGGANLNSDGKTIGNVSSNINAKVSYTFNLDADAKVGLSIEVNDQERKELFSKTMDILIDGELYVSGAHRRNTWVQSSNWNIYYELYLGCVELTQGEHTISFKTNTSNGTVTTNIRSFFVKTPANLIK